MIRCTEGFLEDDFDLRSPISKRSDFDSPDDLPNGSPGTCLRWFSARRHRPVV